MKITSYIHLRTIFYSILIISAISFMSCGRRGSVRVEEESLSDISLTDSGMVEGETDAAMDSTDIEKFPLSDSVEDLEYFLTNNDHSEEYDEGIIPDILQEAPEYAAKLLRNTHDGFIVVDKGRMKVILFDKYGRTQKTYGMACAKNYGNKHKKADSRTPEGFFSIEGIYDSTDWLFTDDDGVTSQKKGQFGPRFIRLRIPTTSQIGIHGTCAPWSIGGRGSHGCIRITNDNILELVELVEPGMPVIVVPGRKDMAQNKLEESETIWIPTIKGAKKPQIAVDNPIKPDTLSSDNTDIVHVDSLVNGDDSRHIAPDSISEDNVVKIDE